ncbi:hypothetical protein K440DRAFT_192818 [Wilcoxina mikolae CBS 423.85]|nr:hypothetical protein K440DRAFT_192818 [Wilcoxina mikolae CBS 423.85]
MMRETILFSFPSISLAPPLSTSSQGLLVLTSSSQPTDFDNDIYLRLQHTPDNEKQSHKTDCLIEAWRELRKISPREFILATEFGDLTITFPELHHLIPQSDSRIDLPAEAKRGMTWEAIVRSFETEVDRFVSYTKNEYSLINSPFGDGGEKNGKAREAGYAGESAGIKPYDPSTFSSTYGDEKRGMGRLVLVDEENGSEVGETQVNSIGVVPGSKGAFFAPRNESGLRLRGGDDGDVDEDDEDDDTTQWTDDLEVLDPVEITFPENGESGPVTVSAPESTLYVTISVAVPVSFAALPSHIFDAAH